MYIPFIKLFSAMKKKSPVKEKRGFFPCTLLDFLFLKEKDE